MSTLPSAIEWREAVSEDGINDPYWTGLEAFVERVEETSSSQLSYPAVLYLISKLARVLQENIAQKLQHEVPESNGDNLLSVPIAVAIPEGIYLPLAIAAVHALNRPIALDHGDHQFHAVLIPLDPSDAPKRLQGMLADAWPCFILTATPCDDERLETALRQMQGNNCDSPSPLHRTNKIRLINVSDAIANVTAPEAELVAALDAQWRQPTRSLMESLVMSDSLVHPAIRSGSSCDDGGNVLSHICFTSGTTGGHPKGCMSSHNSLQNYMVAKNRHHRVDRSSRVLLASSISFDPCLSDILATFFARATLLLARREVLLQHLLSVLQTMGVTHCLCTPTLWSTTLSNTKHDHDPSTRLYAQVPSLQCVALGGERIPPKLLRTWARQKEDCTSSFRLCATYGVTEACVYQTMGEVGCDDDIPHVGLPFDGLNVRICDEKEHDCLVDVNFSAQSATACYGEVVLGGKQLDEYSSYLCRPEESAKRFIQVQDCYFYRTGDRGFIHPTNNKLQIVGRIQGEDGMIKVNGIRIELSEIEAALVDQNDGFEVVVDCMVAAEQTQKATTSADRVACYVVLSASCLKEIGIDGSPPKAAALCASGPLLTLLRHRCKQTVKIMPYAFVIVPRVPLSPTGKRDRRGISRPAEWVPLDSLLSRDGDDSASAVLESHGRHGKVLSDLIVDCLNLQPIQRSMLTTQSTFGMAGGDSLAATRVTRALYARHHDVPDSRFIGGEFGIIDGPFAAKHLINAKSLGSYVDWLESSGVCSNGNPNGIPLPHDSNDGGSDSNPNSVVRDDDDELFEALFQSAAIGYSNIGMALLDLGADPCRNSHKGRLGKITSRLERKKVFRSSPLHLACMHGDPAFVRCLIAHGAAINSPDASGLFPLHLVAVGEPGSAYEQADDKRRIECVGALLEAGAPLSMKDGQKQTVIHVAARSGRQELLRSILQKWNDVYLSVDSRKAGSLDWRDSFNRTPVHWAILNGHVETLGILLKHGCRADPVKMKNAKTSSLTLETPREMAARLYGASAIGERIGSLLKEHTVEDIKG